jgi:hypothetical protein
MKEWLTLSAAKDVLLFLLAVYGAALSTFNWRRSVRKSRREVQVSVSTAMPTYNDGRLGPCFAKVEATNAGHRAVTITALSLELTTGERLFSAIPDAFPGMQDTSLPAALSDGQSAHLFISYRDIAAALIQNGRRGMTKLTPVCNDSVGGIYKGDPWEVDPDEFSRM